MMISMRIALRRIALNSAAVLAIFAGPVVAARAQAGNAAPAPSEAFAAAPETSGRSIPAEGIKHLIDQLDSDTFGVRDFAAERLFEVGRPAIAPLSQVARGNSLEQSTAAVDIIRRLMKSDDTDTKQSARLALGEIAKTGANTAANLAAAALRPAAEPQQDIYPPWAFRRAFGANRFRGRVMIAGGNRRVVIVGPMQPVNPPRANPPVQPAQPANPGPQKPASAK